MSKCFEKIDCCEWQALALMRVAHCCQNNTATGNAAESLEHDAGTGSGGAIAGGAVSGEGVAGELRS